MARVDVSYLKEIFDCDFVHGIVTNKVARRNSPIGRQVGYLGRNGYYGVWVRQKFFSLHQVIWALYYGEFPREMIDHIDGNPRNNAISNLRAASNSLNQANRKARTGGHSKLKGVTWHSGTKRWQAQIKKFGKTYYLGLFETEDEAHQAYLAKAKELFGEFARAA